MNTPTDDPHAPWYRDGLPFACTQCGNCCTGSPGFVWVNQAEIEAIAAHLGISTGALLLERTRLAFGQRTLLDYANGDCTFFDPQTRRCTIYPVRPRQCRTWPFWNSHLESREAWDAAAEGCPGMNTGPLVPLEIIQRQAAVIDL